MRGRGSVAYAMGRVCDSPGNGGRDFSREDIIEAGLDDGARGEMGGRGGTDIGGL